MKTVLADASTVFVLENCGLSDKLAHDSQETINRLGGLNADGVAARKFYPKPDGSQQLNLFNGKTDYNTDDDEEDSA